MSIPLYVVGIDLGTTHCVLAESPMHSDGVKLFEVPQLVAPGEVAPRPLLPSFLYLPSEAELPSHDRTLPWGAADFVVGEAARALGAKVPNRLVSSAKSWICHGGVNRRAPILPWSAPDEAAHISPYDASVHYLSHLRTAWENAHPQTSLAEQSVVVTVPASFDEGARELTAEAALQAGLGEVRLLEEPQAAFYDFIGAHASDLAARLGDARLVLVVDVGGGTTDLTLLKAIQEGEEAQPDQPKLERIAVGGHIMLGGDNMDAALARYVLKKAKIDRKLDPTEWAALVQSSSRAKETLLRADAPGEAVVSVQRRGSRLFGGTKSVPLEREEVRRLLVDGFLPFTGPEEVTDRAGRVGLTTLGLPYANDPAINKHICTFLRRHVDAAVEAGARVTDGLPQPDLLLLNGGVFNAPALVERLSEVLAHWYGQPVPMLDFTCLDTAVARGAARYGLARSGLGQVIGGGTARAYYIGAEGLEGEAVAFCVAPRGMEEGSAIEVPDRVLELVLGRPVAFPLFCYTGDRVDPAGAVLQVAGDDSLEPLPPLETVLKSEGKTLRTGPSGGVPVTLSAAVGERGSLELALKTVELPPQRWRLEFAIEGADKSQAISDSYSEDKERAEPLPPLFNEARRLLLDAFPEPMQGWQNAKGLRRDLEEHLGSRGSWSATTCRALWDAFMERAEGRKSNPAQELNWLRLAGWCMRPGVGVQGDRDRMRRVWQLYAEGLQFPSKANWGEWWIHWRRVAAGLDRDQQETLYQDIWPWLDPGAKAPSGPKVHGDVEMLRLLGALERLPREQRIQAGGWFLERARRGKVNSWWTLGRLGARASFSGEPGDVVPPQVAEAWLDALFSLDWKGQNGAAFAAALMARATGNRDIDISPATRDKVLRRLEQAEVPSSWVDMVTRSTSLSDKDAGRLFGESLPAGLRMT